MSCCADYRCRWISNFPCEELTLLYSLGAACLLVAAHLAPTWSQWQQEGERTFDGFFEFGCNPWECERQRHFVSPMTTICSEYSEHVGCGPIRACQALSVLATVCAVLPVLALTTNCVNKRTPDSTHDIRCASPELKFRATKIAAVFGGACALLSACLWLLVQADLDGWLFFFRTMVAPPPLVGALRLHKGDDKMSLGPAWHMVLFSGVMMWCSALFAHCMPKMCRHVVFAAEGLPEAPRPPPPDRFYLDGITLGRQRVVPLPPVAVRGAYARDDVRRTVDANMA